MTAQVNDPRRPSWRGVAAATGEQGTDRRLTVFATIAIFTGFAGDFWRNLTSWYGFGVVVAIVFVVAIVVLVRRRPPLRFAHLPLPLVLFVGWCAFTLVWSAYRLETLIGVAAQLVTTVVALTIAVTLTKPQFLTAFSLAMRIIIGMSIAFELFVALVFPHGVLPLYMLWPGALDQISGIPGATIDTVPAGFQWSQGNLFRNAAIQGIVGNRNLLAMIALLCLIAVGVQWAAGRIGRWNAIVWLSLSAVVVLLCRSMTVLAATVIVAFALLLIRIARPLTNGQRWVMYGVVGSLMVIVGSFVVLFNNELFGLINRSSDMSGRGDIWWSVSEIARAHWFAGLGWVSYWAPWVEPFKGLQVVDGIQYLQAHNAYLDVWMQTGAVGLAFFSALVLSTLVRTWWLSIDRAQHGVTVRDTIPHTAVLGFLVMVALTVQSMTESRLLIEGNWLLLCYFAIYSKLRIQDLPALPRRTLPTLTGPITTLDRTPIIPPTAETPLPGRDRRSAHDRKNGDA